MHEITKTLEQEFDELSIEFGHLDQSISRDMAQMAEIKPRYQELCGEVTGHDFNDGHLWMSCINCGARNPRSEPDYDEELE